LSDLFGAGIQVPKGKIVKFYHDLDPRIEAYDFYLEEDITLKFSSNFQALVSNETNSGFVLITDFLNEKLGVNIPTTFKQLGFQQWTGTEPLNFSFTIKKFVESNSEYDVIRPFQLLAKLAVPKVINNKGGLEAPGPTALDIIFNKQSKNVHKASLSIQLGSVFIEKVVIQGVEPTFSKEVDEFDGPIWMSLKIDAKTIFTANDQMIDNLFNTTV
jgi:hypothetical protein